MLTPNSEFPSFIKPDEARPGDLVFVYGSLKKGGKYHYILTNNKAEFVGEAQTDVPYPLLYLSYPCLLDKPDQGEIIPGELYRIPSMDAWNDLDWLEDHPTIYQRRRRIFIHQSSKTEAWVYFYLK